MDDPKRIRNLFGNMDHHLSIEGVLTGAVAGRVYASPRAAMVVNVQGLLLGGDPEDLGFFREMNRTVRTEILPERMQTGRLDYVVFRPVGDGRDEAWERALDVLLEGLDAMPDTRLTFHRTLADAETALPAGIEAVTPEMLSDQALAADEGVEGVIEEIRSGWPSLESFFARGFGTVARPDGRIAGWCLTDWVVGDAIEIGIETYPDHRRQGWAKRMAEGTLALAAARGIRRAGWHCWASNTGSARTALAAGLTRTASFPVRFGWCEPRSNHLVNGTYWLKGRPAAGVMPDPALAARHFAAALDIGWDWGGWGGTPWVYWNAACAHFRAGMPDRARMYLKTAIERGWRYPDSIAASPQEHVMPADDAVAALAYGQGEPDQG